MIVAVGRIGAMGFSTSVNPRVRHSRYVIEDSCRAINDDFFDSSDEGIAGLDIIQYDTGDDSGELIRDNHGINPHRTQAKVKNA